jgi:putative tricarboxylic transport membrane protein
MPSARQRARAELALSLGVLALGIAAAIVAWRLPEAGGYARIGPNFVPKLVAGGLILLGVWLLVERFTGGWRSPVPDDAAERGEHPFLPCAFAWVSAGLLAQMALINTAGFVVAAAALFVCVARGFGSERWLRDLAAGLAIGVAVFAFFVHFLNVNLPAGWLKPLLGAAGI